MTIEELEQTIIEEMQLDIIKYRDSAIDLAFDLCEKILNGGISQIDQDSRDTASVIMIRRKQIKTAEACIAHIRTKFVEYNEAS